MSARQGEEKSESLLDVTLKQYPKESMNKIFNIRVFIVTSLTQSADKGYIQEYLRSLTDGNDGLPVHGISFLYPGSTLHLLQTNSDKIFKILKRLRDEKDRHGMWPIKVLLSADNVQFDTIQFYETAVIDSLKQDYFTANTALEVSIAEVYNAILSFAETYSALTDSRKKEAMSKLTFDYRKYLPADFRVLGFAENSELTDLEEYIEIFCSPVEWLPYFDEEWPPQKRHQLSTIEKISEIE